MYLKKKINLDKYGKNRGFNGSCTEQEYVDMLLKLDGLSHIKEDPNAAYCPISLTSTPDELKEKVASKDINARCTKICRYNCV